MIRCAFLVWALLLAAVVRAEGGALQMVGQARLSVMFWPVYDSRLYSPDGNYSEKTRPLRLEIQYLRDVEAQDLVANTRKEWQHLGMGDVKQQQWLAALERLWPDVGENDVLALVVDEQDRSTFLLNGKALGTIDDPAFGGDFLAIWLSPETSRPDLRLALLGGQ
jgi:hypothetical protein